MPNALSAKMTNDGATCVTYHVCRAHGTIMYVHCNLHASQTDTRPGALRFGLASKGWESFDWRHDRPGTLRGFFLVKFQGDRVSSQNSPSPYLRDRTLKRPAWCLSGWRGGCSART